VGATGLFVLAIRVWGKSLVHLLYAGRYDGVAPLLFMLSVLPLLMAIGHTMNNALIAAEKPKLVFFAYLCSGAATFLLGMPLVMYYGLWGAVYGMLLSGVTYTTAFGLAFTFHLHRWHVALACHPGFEQKIGE
jgi:O-antigen/teichoic acid export membrane protein